MDVWRRLTSKNAASVIALADTGASKSIIGLALVKKYKLKLDTKNTQVSLTNASGHKMSMEGMVTIFLQPAGAPTRKMIKAIVSESVGNNFLIGLPDLKHLQLLPEDFPRYRGEKYTVSNSRQNPTDLVEAHITTDAGSNVAAGTIHWSNGASQNIFWDKGEGENSVENVRATKSNTGGPELEAADTTQDKEENPESVKVGIKSERINDHNGQDLPEGLEDMDRPVRPRGRA